MPRNRSGTADTEEAVAKLPLPHLNALIEHALNGYQTGGSSQGRKSFFQRLVWMEGLREQLHGIEAPKRRFNR